MAVQNTGEAGHANKKGKKGDHRLDYCWSLDKDQDRGQDFLDWNQKLQGQVATEDPQKPW